MVAAVGWNVGDLLTGDESVIEEIGEVIGLVFHVAAIALPGAGPPRVLGPGPPGALVKAAATLVAGMAVGILIGWGLVELFPGSLARRTGLCTRSTG